VTVVLLVLETVALNCFCAPAMTCAEDGDTLTDTGRATVTAAEPDRDGSAIEVATTLTCAGEGRFAGAV
jgi:hypothetical protein